MKHVSIVLPSGDFILPSIIGPYMMLRSANSYVQNVLGKNPVFEIDIVGINPEENIFSNTFTVKPTKLINEIKKTDLIIIGTINGDLSESLERNKPFLDWIIEQRSSNNTEIASLCMSAFLLAKTGILDGKSCTTHWMAETVFNNLFENVNLNVGKVITEDDGIYTSGGAFSYMNLILYLIEKHYGVETAIWVSKIMEVEYLKYSQQHFAIFQGQKEHKDDPIIAAQNYIESNFEKKISVEKLALNVALSPRSFVRRFKKATSNTPTEYIQRVKIEASKKKFESSSVNINEVMYSVGYNDTKAFRRIFRKYTGLSPREYKSKFNRTEASS